MQIQENISLKNYNSFKIDVRAKKFVELNSTEEIINLINEKNLAGFENLRGLNYLILGTGSNILFTKDFDGTILKINNKGIEVIKETGNYVYVKANAGEIWDDLIVYCIEHNYFGLENLSMIPGTVGAAPIQNIGAYGVELKDVFYQLEAIDIKSGEIKIYTKPECKFGYRDSIFKHKLKNRVIILSITLKLRKKETFNCNYADLRNELNSLGITEPTAAIVRDIVCRIRAKKLPYPSELGSAGSFFKNPVINEVKFTELINKYSDLKYYSLPVNKYKLAAGWMIEKCGWKGKRTGDVGVHKEQALVIVNYNNATGADITSFANKLMDEVMEQFGVLLDFEVNII
jgi:UDP-N-acetylmuramate dehydrogenase